MAYLQQIPEKGQTKIFVRSILCFQFFLVDVGLHSMKQQMFMYVLYVTHLFQDSTFDLLLFLSKMGVVKLRIGLSASAAYPPVVTVFHSRLLDTR